MADDDSILTNPPTHEVGVHVHDYERFTRLLKYGAITCLIFGILWLLIVKAYW